LLDMFWLGRILLSVYFRKITSHLSQTGLDTRIDRKFPNVVSSSIDLREMNTSSIVRKIMSSLFSKTFVDVLKIATTGVGFACVCVQQHENTKMINQTLISADRRAARYEVLKEFDEHPVMAAAARLLDPETAGERFHPVPPSISTEKSVSLTPSIVSDAMHLKNTRECKIVRAFFEQWFAYFHALNGMVERGEVEEDIVKEALIDWMRLTKANADVYTFGKTTHFEGDPADLRYPGFGKLFLRWGLEDGSASEKAN
jgi:hypothetical protein